MSHESTNWHVGDLVLFSGKSLFSRIIRVRTCSPYSHVAIVAKVGANDLAVNSTHLPTGDWDRRNLLFESTTLSEFPCSILGQSIAGTQSHEPMEVAEAYAGRVWQMSLRDQWNPNLDESRRLTASLLDNLGVAYDTVGAGLSSTILLKYLGCAWRAGDRSTLVCVEYAAQALLDAFCTEDRVPRWAIDLHPGKMTPRQFVKWAQQGPYHPPERVK